MKIIIELKIEMEKVLWDTWYGIYILYTRPSGAPSLFIKKERERKKTILGHFLLCINLIIIYTVFQLKNEKEIIRSQLTSDYQSKLEIAQKEILKLKDQIIIQKSGTHSEQQEQILNNKNKQIEGLTNQV